MPPTGGETGARNMRVGAQVARWADEDGSGVVFDSSTGFELLNGAVRSPDMAWVANARLARLSMEEKRRFLPLCPDFVIELCSPTDSVAEVSRRWRSTGQMALDLAGSWISTGGEWPSVAPTVAWSGSNGRSRLPVIRCCRGSFCPRPPSGNLQFRLPIYCSPAEASEKVDRIGRSDRGQSVLTLLAPQHATRPPLALPTAQQQSLACCASATSLPVHRDASPGRGESYAHGEWTPNSRPAWCSASFQVLPLATSVEEN